MTFPNPTLIEDGEAAIRQIIDAAITPRFEESNEPQLTHRPIALHELVGAPPERQWIWEGFIPAGYVSSLYGDGGTGKTLMAQQLATAVSVGNGLGRETENPQLFDKNIQKGPVLMLLSEDDDDEIWRRQVDINQAVGCTMEQLGDLHIISGFGRDNLLMEFDKKAGKLRHLHEHLVDLAKRIKPVLIVIDNAADTFGGEENQRCAVTQFMKVALGGLAYKTQAAVLLIAHPSVHGKESGSGFAGSTAWNNSVRSRLYLSGMDKNEDGFNPDYRTLELMKANYSRTSGTLSLCYDNGAFKKQMAEDEPGVTTDYAGKKAMVFKELSWLIEQGENLSPNSRAGNHAAKRLAQCEPVRRAKIYRNEVDRILDSLMRDQRVKIEDYRKNGKEHQRYVICEEPDA